jgi:hypothetical protein
MRGVNGNRAHPRRAGVIFLCVAAFAVAGYGSGGSSDRTSSNGGEPSPAANSKGVKPEEKRTALHLSRRDCDLLGAGLVKRTGRTIRISSEPKPPLSGCRLQGPGIDVTISLDTSYGAHQRYLNRVVETQQFGAPDQAKMPHPVPGVGEPGAYGQSANWIPALGTMLAVRGNRWLTVNYGAAGESLAARKAAAAAIARRAFKLSAR